MRQGLYQFLEGLITDMNETAKDASEALEQKAKQVSHSAMLKLGEQLHIEWESVVRFAYDGDWALCINNNDWPDNHIQAWQLYKDTL